MSFNSSFKDIFDWKGIKVKLSSNFVLIWRQIDKEFEILGQNLVLIITMDTRPVITFGVFGGGVSGHQVSAFCTTFAQVQLSFATRVSLRLNLITNKLVHERNMSEEEVFQQLHEADVYLILGHMHQGNPQWSAITVLDLLSVLQCSSKIGWPQRRHLTCPVFTQDKGRYIEKCRVVTIPTLKLNLENFWISSTNMKKEMVGSSNSPSQQMPKGLNFVNRPKRSLMKRTGMPRISATECLILFSSLVWPTARNIKL